MTKNLTSTGVSNAGDYSPSVSARQTLEPTSAPVVATRIRKGIVNSRDIVIVFHGFTSIREHSTPEGN